MKKLEEGIFNLLLKKVFYFKNIEKENII